MVGLTIRALFANARGNVAEAGRLVDQLALLTGTDWVAQEQIRLAWYNWAKATGNPVAVGAVPGRIRSNRWVTLVIDEIFTVFLSDFRAAHA